jgi:hypothetical protein
MSTESLFRSGSFNGQRRIHNSIKWIALIRYLGENYGAILAGCPSFVGDFDDRAISHIKPVTHGLFCRRRIDAARCSETARPVQIIQLDNGPEANGKESVQPISDVKLQAAKA